MTEAGPLLVNPTPPSALLKDAWGSAETLMKSFGGNTGNMAFLNACLLTIDNLRPVRERSFSDASAIVWGCSNFLAENRAMGGAVGPAFESGKPVIAIGLGAQASNNDRTIDLPEGSLSWLQGIADGAGFDGPNISVRGTYTKQVLDAVGVGDSAIVLGCPSLYLSPDPHLGASIAQKLTDMDTPEVVGVCPGNLRDGREETMAVEQVLWDMTTEKSADYLIQHPTDVFSLLLSEPDALTPHRIRVMAKGVAPDMAVEEFLVELRRRASIFAEPASWILSLRRMDMVASARFHGAQFALQAGVPALCITIDERHREMCDLMLVPHIDRKDVHGLTWERALDLLRSHDWAAFDQQRRALARTYGDFLSSNGLTPTNHLTGLFSS